MQHACMNILPDADRVHLYSSMPGVRGEADREGSSPSGEHLTGRAAGIPRPMLLLYHTIETSAL
jgi:hypothetical protein